MRLIDADSLKDYIDCGHLRPPTELCFSELDVCNMIDKRPTIDAVEVVRCKDCKYKRLYDEGETKYYYCALEDRPNRNWSVDDTDYCSWGEEREVEE